MKLIRFFAPLFLLASTLHAAAPAGQRLTSPDQVPAGLQPSDWQSLRVALENSRHAFQAVEGGHAARTPGQQWCSQFDARGFLTQPDAGGWSWGLELRGYGFAGHQVRAGGDPRVEAVGTRLTRTWDPALAEWYVNDARGLEHGFTLARRPAGFAAGQPLGIELALRGSLAVQVAEDGQSVRFVEAQGGVVLNFGGLQAWDADGQTLPARMVAAGGGGLRYEIEEAGARYPITVDPVAQQAYFKPEKIGGSQMVDRMGTSVAVSGDTVVVGAIGERSNSTGVNCEINDRLNPFAGGSGAAYVFVRSGTTWTQEAFLKASNAEASDQFGSSVAISGDTVVVGASGEDSSTTGVNTLSNETSSGSGAAYVYVRVGSSWMPQAYLKPGAVGSTQADDRFGASVAISGDTLVVGAPQEDSDSTGVNSTPNENVSNAGAAYVFVRSGTTWTQQAYLKAFNSGFADFFGFSVAASGDTVVVGAYGEATSASGVNPTPDDSAGNAGAAYVFARSGTTWTQEAFLKESNAEASDRFGSSVALSGDTLVVGSPLEDSSTTGVNTTSDEAAGDSGAAYVFTRSGTTWTQQAYLKADAMAPGNHFGNAVAVSGDVLVVGAPVGGRAYLFSRSGTTWTQQANFAAATTAGSDQFGTSVGISGDLVGVGASAEGYNTTGINSTPIGSAGGSGAAYAFVNAVPHIAAEQPAGSALTSGGARSTAAVAGGAGTDLVFTVKNTGYEVLNLTGTPAPVALSGSSDFSITAQPAATVAAGDSTTFTVRFTTATAGPKTATLSIPSDAANQSPYVIQLSGTGLTFTTDTDADGMSDAAEFQLTALGFDWQTSQPALVTNYFANANNNGLYTTSQVQALHVGTPLIQRNQATGKFTLTIGVKKTAILGQPFTDFPMTGPGTGVFINGAGKLEFEFPSPGNAAFFRLESQ